MSARSLKHADEIFYKEVPIESVKPGETVFGLGGNHFKVKEVMPCEGGYFVEFVNAPTFKLVNGCSMMLKGAVVL